MLGMGLYVPPGGTSPDNAQRGLDFPVHADKEHAVAVITLADQFASLKPEFVISVEQAYDGVLSTANVSPFSDAYHLQALQDAEAFIAFLWQQEPDRVRAYAVRQCNEGMPAETIFRFYGAARAFCERVLPQAQQDQALHVLDVYSTAYAAGFALANAAKSSPGSTASQAPASGDRAVQHTPWLTMAAEISRAVSSILNVGDLLDRAAYLLRKYSGATAVAVSLIDDTDGWATVQAVSAERDGEMASKPPPNRINPGDYFPIGQCLSEGAPVIAFDNTGALVTPDLPKTSGMRSVMALPLISHGQLIGAISFNSVQSLAFTTDDQVRPRLIVDQIANAIENARLYRELSSYAVALEGMVQARTYELQRNKEYLETILENSPDAIVSLDTNGMIKSGNKAFYVMFDYDSQDVAVISVAALATEADQALMRTNLRSVLETSAVARFRINARRRDGTRFDLEAAIAPIMEDGVTTGLICNLRDVTEIVHAENLVKGSLREKNVLLQEIHHRVKNNLQIVASLLNLQTYLVNDPTAVQALVESQNRIRAMALIHEQLYRSSDLSSVDFVQFVTELVGFVRRSFEPVSRHIEIVVKVSALSLSLNVAIPCGLIINELVSNAFKHAFPDSREGTITVSMGVASDGQLMLAVHDNGVGFPASNDPNKTTTLGLQLTRSLASQLNGTFQVDSKEGDTRLEVRFVNPASGSSAANP
jgi:PAS domain S-box-containing protein